MTTGGVRNKKAGNIDYNPRNAWEGQLDLELGVPYQVAVIDEGVRRALS